jgi:hypothetical protein
VKGWLVNEKELDVLVVKYEDLVENLEETVLRMGSFCEIDISDMDLARALERSRFHYMKTNQNKFGIRPG